MASDSQPLRFQLLHEAATSFNLAFALMAFLMIGDQPIPRLLFTMDRRFSGWVGLLGPRADFTYGYFAFLVPATLLALGLWCLLRLAARTDFARTFLHFAGIVALVAPPLWFLCFLYDFNDVEHRYAWNPFEEFPVYEVLLILVLGIAFISGRWHIPYLAAVAVLVIHYGFWFWQFGRSVFFMGYGGPLGPALGLSSGLTWLLYLRGQPRLNAVA
jgi:hypothetical protein